MTTSFFAPPQNIRDGYLTLPDDEAHHAVRVLRHRAGNEIIVVDGAGGWYHVRLDQAERGYVAGPILEMRRDVGEPGYDLTIGLALLKNRNRFETFLEKAVELGVTEIVPLLTHRTEERRMKRERAEGILLAGMKQSGRSHLVRLSDPQPLTGALGAPPGTQRLLCQERAGVLLSQSLMPSVDAYRILIGPEGGFTDDEVARAVMAGYNVVSLGPRRLRAETAAMTAATAVLLARGND